MISMNTKNWQADIEVRIFIIHMTKSVQSDMTLWIEDSYRYTQQEQETAFVNFFFFSCIQE